MRLNTLGGLELEGSDFSSPQPLLLVAYLALEGPKDRRFLAELFWLGTKEPLARLSVALTRLRKGAPGAIEADNRRAWATVETDAQQLLSALESRELAAGLDLYRGPFLEGVYLRDWGAELEEWVYATREFVAGRVGEALISLAETEASGSEMETATRRAERAFELVAATAEPELLGRVHTLLLAGESSRAAAAAAEAAAFGVETAASVEQARAKLHRDPVAAAAPVPHNLPLAATTFVGRDPEIAEIPTLLADSGRRLITLVGPGGVGKTRLALRVAEELLRQRSFPGGIYQVELDALSSAAFIPASLADVLGVSMHGTGATDSVLAEVAAAIGERSMLLLLDNYEHLMEGATLPAELLEICRNLKVLVTSRERLNLEEEWVFPVEGLAFPPDSESVLERAKYFDALRLFAQRARRVRPDFVITHEDLPHALEICRLVEGSPLGLELAATWIQAMTVREIAGEIARSSDFLATRTRNVAPRHRSIRAAFESSWALLEPRERDALAGLSVFRGGFRREAAAEVVGVTIPLLVSLIDKSLLRLTPTGRYERHPLLYVYMREKLAERTEALVEAEAGHGAYFLRFMLRWREKLGSDRVREALAAIEEELENVRLAWHWLLREGCDEDLIGFSHVVKNFYDRVGRVQEGFDLLGAAVGPLEEAGEARVRALGYTLVHRAWLGFRLGRYQHASELARRCLELLRPLNEGVALQSALRTLGAVAIQTGDFDGAQHYLLESIEQAEANGSRKSLSDSLINLAVLEKDLGEFEMAGRHYREGLAIKRQDGDRVTLALGMNNYGELLNLMGRHSEAYELLEEGLRQAEELDLRFGLPYFRLNLGLSALALGELAEARSHGLEALRLLESAESGQLKSNVLVLLGKVELASGDDRQAEASLLAALSEAWAIRALPDVLWVLLELADFWTGRGQPELAARLLGFVENHPAGRRLGGEAAASVLGEIEKHLSKGALAAALAEGRELDESELVAGVLGRPVFQA